MTDQVHPKPFRTWIAIDVAKDFNAVVIQSDDKAKNVMTQRFLRSLSR